MKKIILLSLLAFTACKKEDVKPIETVKEITDWEVKVVSSNPTAKVQLDSSYLYQPIPTFHLKKGEFMYMTVSCECFKEATVYINGIKVYQKDTTGYQFLEYFFKP